MQKCATIWLQMKLTITEYNLTTSAQVDYKIQKERTLHLVLRLRGETEHDTNDNVTTKGIASAWWNRARHQWQRDHQDPEHLLHKAHDINTWIDARVIPCAHSPVVRFLSSWLHTIHAQVSLVRVISWSSHDERITSTLSPPFPSTSSSSHSSSISRTSSCTSSTTLRTVVTLRASPERRWTPLKTTTSSHGTPTTQPPWTQQKTDKLHFFKSTRKRRKPLTVVRCQTTTITRQLSHVNFLKLPLLQVPLPQHGHFF